MRAAARRRVVRTFLLAHVAAENPLAELWPQVGVDRPTVLDRQVGDAAFGSQVIRLIQGIRRTRVDAQATAATVFCHWRIEVQIHVGEQGAKENERANRSQDIGVLAPESEASSDSGVALDERAIVDGRPRFHYPACLL